MTAHYRINPTLAAPTLSAVSGFTGSVASHERMGIPWEPSRITIRRVQRTGVSSLAVTLPKSWTDSVGVRHGDALRFLDTGRGALEITTDRNEPRPNEEPHAVTLAVTDAPPPLIADLLAGAYIAGHDRVTLTTRKAFSAEQRDAILRRVNRTPGLSVVAELPDVITLVVSVDPTKRRLSGLVDHLTQLIQHEFALYRRALAQRSALLLAPIENIEDDLTRTYLLFARELLIAMGDLRVAQKLGAEGPRAQVGFQVVGSALAAIGEQASSMAQNLAACMHSACFPVRAGVELGSRIAGREELLALTLQAFNQLSASDAHMALTMIGLAREELASNLILPNEGKRCNLLLQNSTSILITIGEHLRTINRETLSRSVEPSTVARLGGQAVVIQLPA